MEKVRKSLETVLAGLPVVAVGTRSGDLRPEGVLAAGVTIGPGAGQVTVWVPEAGGERTFANLRENGAVAVVVEKPATHRTVQVKGRCVEVREALDADREALAAAHEAFVAAVVEVGLPTAMARRRRTWPCRAVVVEVAEVFEQTPGPDAGCPYPREGTS